MPNTKVRFTEKSVRCETLEQISGLYVYVFENKGEACYTFCIDSNRSVTIKSVYTYRKAKVFAEGVKVGRMIS